MRPSIEIDRVNRLVHVQANVALSTLQSWLTPLGVSLPLLRPLPALTLQQLCHRSPALLDTVVHHGSLQLLDDTQVKTLHIPRGAMGPSVIAAAWTTPPLARLQSASLRMLPHGDIASDVIDMPAAEFSSYLLRHMHDREGWLIDAVSVGGRMRGAKVRSRTVRDLASSMTPMSLPATRSSAWVTAAPLLWRATSIHEAIAAGERIVAWPNFGKMMRAQIRRSSVLPRSSPIHHANDAAAALAAVLRKHA
jgi:hypothetical protein